MLYRVEGGREWLPLGVFDGNTDMFTEVAHRIKVGSGGKKESAVGISV